MKITDVSKVLKAALRADDTVLIEGLHGIGKSEVVHQFSIGESLYMVDLRLSNNEVGDLIGIPHNITLDDGTVVTKWAKPSWLHRMEEAAKAGKQCLLFLDELNRAPLDVRQCAMQLVLDGMIHEHHLPTAHGRKTMIVGAINPADEYQVEELDPALLDRFLSIYAEVDTQSWLKYAKKTGVNQIVRDFIAEHPDRIHYTPKDGGVGTTPRSWVKLARFIDFKDEIEPEIIIQIITGRLGKEVGSQFYSFMLNYVDFIKVEDIEEIVNDNKDSVSNIDELGDMIADKIEKVEAIQLHELAASLADKYAEKDDILPFIAYMYALKNEVLIGFLKGFRKDNPTGYKKLAQVDKELNDKQLFKRVVNASDKTD